MCLTKQNIFIGNVNKLWKTAVQFLWHVLFVVIKIVKMWIFRYLYLQTLRAYFKLNNPVYPMPFQKLSKSS